MVLTLTSISCPPAVFPARGTFAQWWNIHRNVKDSTCKVICYTSFEVCAFSICMCRESDRAHTCTHGTWGSLSSPIRFLGVTHFPCSTSFLFPCGPSRIQKTCGLCTLHISAAVVWGGPGLLSQQRTIHHFLLSSLLLGLITESKHSGSMILLVSQGGFFIQFSSQHCSVARPRQRGATKERNRR